MPPEVNITCSTGPGFAWQFAKRRDLVWWELLRADGIFAFRWHRVKVHPNGCWFLQMAPCCRAGHILLGRRGRRVYAHRHAYALAFGRIPKGRVVRHVCDDPACIYPGHLIIGTQRANVGDAVARERRNAFGRQRVQLSQVNDIRCRFEAGERQVDLARSFGVSKGCISAIVHRKAWNGTSQALAALPQQPERHDDIADQFALGLSAVSSGNQLHHDASVGRTLTFGTSKSGARKAGVR